TSRKSRAVGGGDVSAGTAPGGQKRARNAGPDATGRTAAAPDPSPSPSRTKCWEPRETSDYTRALKWLRQALVPVDEYPARETLNHLFLAMAHHQLGHADEATRALAQARAVAGRVKPQRAERPDLDEIEWLRVELVRQEAKGLIGKQGRGPTK